MKSEIIDGVKNVLLETTQRFGIIEHNKYNMPKTLSQELLLANGELVEVYLQKVEGNSWKLYALVKGEEVYYHGSEFMTHVLFDPSMNSDEPEEIIIVSFWPKEKY